MKNLWEKIKKPIFALAPMHDVTDTAFRQVVLKCGRPDLFFTEFVSIDGICNEKSQEKLISHYFGFSKKEKPIIAQIWGSDPEKFYKAALLIKKLGFDGVDINIGCPDKAVVKSGGGSALILKPKLAVEIIKATKESGLPVSVKTRIGFDKIITEKWIEALLEAKPAAITVHGRTKKELSSPPVHWDEIGKAAKIAKGSGVLILGNGDIKSKKEGEGLAVKYDLDGIMIGRGALTNPWVFDSDKKRITVSDRIKLALWHSQIFEKSFGKNKNFWHIRKHLSHYIVGFNDAKELRSGLMTAKNSKEIKEKIKEWMIKNKI